jgi:hypothetical protein
MSYRFFSLCAVVVLASYLGCGSSSNSSDAGSGTGGVPGNGGGGAGGGTAASCHAAGTLNVLANDSSAYTIDGVSNPDLTLCRMSTYAFNLNTPGHPFYIKTVQSTGAGNAFSEGVTGNGTETGMVTFVVPSDAPNTLYYNCSIHAVMTGTIHVVDGP